MGFDSFMFHFRGNGGSGLGKRERRFVGWALPTDFQVFIRLCCWAEPIAVPLTRHSCDKIAWCDFEQPKAGP